MTTVRRAGERAELGRSGVVASRVGLGASYGIGGADLEYAFERGVTYFYWGSLRTAGFAEGLRRLAARQRERMVVVVQSYTRVAALMRRSLEQGLRRLRLDHADFLLLGNWNAPVPERILAAARELVELGLANHLMVSCHSLPSFAEHAADLRLDALMVRYNAAHPEAESRVFPGLPRPAPGLVAYTATCWGQLLGPGLAATGERVPSATDCIRFCLSHPSVNLCLSGPADRRQLDDALRALELGPLEAEELAWMRRVGAAAAREPRLWSAARQLRSSLARRLGPRPGS